MAEEKNGDTFLAKSTFRRECTESKFTLQIYNVLISNIEFCI